MRPLCRDARGQAVAALPAHQAEPTAQYRMALLGMLVLWQSHLAERRGAGEMSETPTSDNDLDNVREMPEGAIAAAQQEQEDE